MATLSDTRTSFVPEWGEDSTRAAAGAETSEPTEPAKDSGAVAAAASDDDEKSPAPALARTTSRASVASGTELPQNNMWIVMPACVDPATEASDSYSS